MPGINLPDIRRQLNALQTRGGRRTALEAHTRLDLVDLQIEALSSAVEQAATGQADLAKSVLDLTNSVATLNKISAQTQDSLKTFVADTKDGRELITKMITEVIERKTGGWVMWLGVAAISSAGSWMPKVFEIFRLGLSAHG